MIIEGPSESSDGDVTDMGLIGPPWGKHGPRASKPAKTVGFGRRMGEWEV